MHMRPEDMDQAAAGFACSAYAFEIGLWGLRRHWLSRKPGQLGSCMSPVTLVKVGAWVQVGCCSWAEPSLLCLQLPPQFSDDLFAAMDPKHRPDHRWLILGPARSGSSFHQDPNATSAWNAVIYGSKKWILYPPHITPPGKPGLVCPSSPGVRYL